MIEKGLLQSLSERIGRKRFDRGDFEAVYPGRGNHAGADDLTVEQDRASTAIAGVAADLGAGEPEAPAKRRRQALGRRNVEADLVAIDQGLDAGLGHRHAVAAEASERRTSVRAASRR